MAGHKGGAAVTVSTNVKVPASGGKAPTTHSIPGEKEEKKIKKRQRVDGLSGGPLQGSAGGILVPWPGLAPPAATCQASDGTDEGDSK